MEENIFQKIRNSAKSVTSQAQDVKVKKKFIIFINFMAKYIYRLLLKK